MLLQFTLVIFLDQTEVTKIFKNKKETVAQLTAITKKITQIFNRKIKSLWVYEVRDEKLLCSQYKEVQIKISRLT